MNLGLESDSANPNFAGAHNPDAALSVRFYSKPVQNHSASTEQGRPIFADIDYVQIFTPGNQLNIIDAPATESHKARFPRHWAHYQNTKGGDTGIGTPLNEWPMITAAQAEELKALKFFTVESVAHASDAQIENIGMCGGMAPHSFRARALAYLTAASDSAFPQKQAEEIEKLRIENTAHQAEMAELRKMVESLAANQKAKPGRKKSSETLA